MRTIPYHITHYNSSPSSVRRSEQALPVGGTGRGAAGAQNALVHAIQLLAVHLALQVLSMVQVMTALLLESQPGLDGGVLGVEVAHVGHEVLDDVHVGQRIDLDGGRGLLVDEAQTCQGVAAVDVHCT